MMVCAIGLNAQNAIEYNTFFNQDNFNFMSEASVANVTHGALGEGATWDFTDLKEGEHAQEWYGEAIEPINSLNPEYFDQADLCLATESGVNKFWNHEEDGLSYLGYETADALLVLDNPLINMPYPFNYGQVHEDIGEGMMYGNCSDYKWHCELTAEVVGVGTLMLPDATFENAFKVKREMMITRTSMKTGNDRLYTSDEFVWYVNGVPGPVMEIKNWYRDVCYGPTEGKSVNFSTISREDNLSLAGIFDVDVYPNPSAGMSNVRIKSDNETGKQMREMDYINVNRGQTDKSLDLKNLEPGVYMVEILNGNQKVTRKLIIE